MMENIVGESPSPNSPITSPYANGGVTSAESQGSRVLVIQIVQIFWTKATRGAPRSHERAALPRAFLIETEPGKVAVERFRMDEWNQFVPTLLETKTTETMESLNETFRIMPEGTGYRIDFMGLPYWGQPQRPAIQNLLHLNFGEYARLAINARHTTYSGQYYSETIYHIACGTEVVPNRFLASTPDHDVDLKRHLF